MRPAHAILLAATAVFASGGTAWAHAHLKSAEPPVGATVATAPHEVAILFSESVEPRFSRIEVSDAKGARVDGADPHTAPADAKRLIVSLKPLTPGTYKVVWHATSTDTHQTDGSYSFTVRP